MSVLCIYSWFNIIQLLKQRNDHPLQPGDLVKMSGNPSFGMLIHIDDSNATVLWARAPKRATWIILIKCQITQKDLCPVRSQPAVRRSQ